LLCFGLFSGIIGPHIIGHGIGYKYGFEIYGETGKGLLFSAVTFLLLAWRKKPLPILSAWRRTNVWWGIGALLALIAGWISINKLLDHHPEAIWAISVHVCILLAVLLLLCFSFGIQSLSILYKRYKKEVFFSIVLGALFVGFLYVIYGLWTVLASMALNSVRYLLDAVGVHSAYVPPRTLVFSKFGINVAQYCSGIESIALFTGLYGLIGVLDWQRFNHKKYLVIFLPALMVLFGFNILRIFALILGGYYINPQIAFSLFHTYAGMLFFIVYSILFWKVSYRWMLQKDS
jgi:exosortase/archaeosortase family protein